MQSQTIPLSQLKPSPNNVRKTGGIPIYKLASSIAAHGLLQNLVVSPTGSGFLVEAGGRRLQALMELAKDGRIPNDHPVACQIVEAGISAHEASLAENIAREAMHPVDEFVAFKQLADEGHDAAVIADRFGATEKHIRQRLKLANVSPKLLAEYRAGKATLEQMQVLALVDDHGRQEKAWGAGARESWRRRADAIAQRAEADTTQAGDGVDFQEDRAEQACHQKASKKGRNQESRQEADAEEKGGQGMKAYQVDDETVYGANTADEAAQLYSDDTGEACDDGFPVEMTDVQLDAPTPEYDENEELTGNTTTLRAALDEMKSPGFLASSSW